MAPVVFFFIIFQLLYGRIFGRVLDFLNDFESIPFDKSGDACRHNSELLAQVLSQNASNNTLRFPVNTTFHFHHGIISTSVNNTVIELDGTLRFEKAASVSDNSSYVLPCITIERSTNVTLTSNYRGLIDGRGSQYWGIPLIGYVQRKEHRPRLLRFVLVEELLIENIILQDSPYHTLYLDAVNRVEVRNISIIARRTRHDGHGWVDLTAFNTDGIDVAGSNVHIHDCDIWVQDDCIAVKDVKNHTNVTFDPVSSNMTFERINATGIGFTIGSIQGTHVKNITFRDSYLHRTVKGIYMKFSYPKARFTEHNFHALVEDILYENIVMEAPTQWPIWIGPAQQADTSDFCHPNPCSLCWPMTPGSKCYVVPMNKFRNITLRNISINNPELSPGVLIGSHADTIDDVVFEDVLVTLGSPLPISQMGIDQTFPGTRQPIHDAYVPGYFAESQHKLDGLLGRTRTAILHAKSVAEKTRGTYATAAINLVQNGGGVEQWYLSVILQSVLGTTWMWLLLALFMAILAACVLRNWKRFSRSDEARSRRWLYHSLYALLFFVFFFSCLCSLILPFRKPKWQRTSRYYQCKGVNNGIARGTTWPIPACFREEKSLSSTQDEDLTLSSSSHVHLTICLLCLSSLMVLVVYWKDYSESERYLESDEDRRTGSEAPHGPSPEETNYSLLEQDRAALLALDADRSVQADGGRRRLSFRESSNSTIP